MDCLESTGKKFQFSLKLACFRFCDLLFPLFVCHLDNKNPRFSYKTSPNISHCILFKYSTYIVQYLTLFTRLQCWDCGVQEYLLYCLGCWRSGQNPATVETLLHKHTGEYFILLKLQVHVVRRRFPSLSACRDMKGWRTLLLYSYSILYWICTNYVSTYYMYRCMLCCRKLFKTYLICSILFCSCVLQLYFLSFSRVWYLLSTVMTGRE